MGTNQPTSEPDIHVQVEGSRFRVTVAPHAIRAFADPRLAHLAQGGGSVVLEHGEGDELIQALLDAGVRIHRLRDPEPDPDTIGARHQVGESSPGPADALEPRDIVRSISMSKGV